jgi:hypothetical protein
MNHQKLNLMGCHIIKQSVYLRGEYSPLLYVKALLRTPWGIGFEETAKTLDTLMYVLYPIRLTAHYLPQLTALWLPQLTVLYLPQLTDCNVSTSAH